MTSVSLSVTIVSSQMVDKEDSFQHTQSQPQAISISSDNNSDEAQRILSVPVITSRDIDPALATPKPTPTTRFTDITTAPYEPTQWETEPQTATCTKCGTTGKTVVQWRCSETNFFWSGWCCMMGGLCVLGVMCRCCMNAIHRCPHCRHTLGYRSAV